MSEKAEPWVQLSKSLGAPTQWEGRCTYVGADMLRYEMIEIECRLDREWV